MVKYLSLIAPFVLAACSSTPAPVEPPAVRGSAETPHLLELADDAAPAPGIESLDFLVGRWEGEAFGGWVEESWSPLKGGAMLGSFRLVKEDGPAFYELMLITEMEGRPHLRVKHFSADMSPWEEGAESVNFPLLEVEGQTAWFGGLTMHRVGDDHLVYLAMKGSKGAVTEESLTFRRVSGD